MRRRQQSYIDASVPVDASDVLAWTRRRRFWNNAVAMFGPVL
jgi:cardiolipin synthase A/B